MPRKKKKGFLKKVGSKIKKTTKKVTSSVKKAPKKVGSTVKKVKTNIDVKVENHKKKAEVRKENRQERKQERKDDRLERKQDRKENRAERKQDRKEHLKGRNLLGKVMHGAAGTIKNTVKNTPDIVRDTTKNIRETKLGEAAENAFEAKFRTFNAKVWQSQNGHMNYFPEVELPNVMKRQNIGLCFSGGGARSAVASFGIMRALISMGFDKKLRYTTSNSGGSWFAIPYTFLPKGITDKDFFGEYIPLENISSIEQLRENSRKSRFCLSLTRGKIWGRSFAGMVVDKTTNTKSNDENWSRAVGNAILKPMRLYDAERVAGANRFFTWSAKTRADALAANKFLEAKDFHIVEKSRPFNITVGVMIREGNLPVNVLVGLGSNIFKSDLKLGPVSTKPTTNTKNLLGMSLFEMTPYYSGISTTHSKMGGHFIESFGQDSHLKTLGKTSAKVKLKKTHKRFTLTDIVGISGSALAALDKLTNEAFTPDLFQWYTKNGMKAGTYNAVDGGYLDNQAIMPLLKRKVPKIIVCANADLSVVKNARIIPSVEHLFGVTDEVTNVTRASLHTKHVFSNKNNELNKLHEAVIANNKSKGVSFHRGIYEVIDNKNYGINRYKVEVFWYFLDRSKAWNSTINKIQGLSKNTTVRGSVTSLKKHFPNYKTPRLNLSEEEISLLSNYTHWCFKSLQAELKDFFN